MERPRNLQSIKALLSANDTETLRELLCAIDPNEIGALFAKLKKEDRPRLFRLLSQETAAKVFSRLKANEKRILIERFNDRELASLSLTAVGIETEEHLTETVTLTPRRTAYLKTSAYSIFLSRIPWLLLLMISATFTGMIISAFESALSTSVYLTAFIPMLMDTGGNSGNQASVTVIRALSLGEITFSDTLRIIKKEAVVALLCAVTLGAASFAKIYLLDFLLLKTLTAAEASIVPLVVSLSLSFTVLFAKLIGASLPIAARRLGFDPAVMASPFITTVVDTVSLAVYFRIACFFIPGL